MKFLLTIGRHSLSLAPCLHSNTLLDFGTWLAFTPVTDPPVATGDPVVEVTVEVPTALLNANSKLFLRVRAEVRMKRWSNLNPQSGAGDYPYLGVL